ncbi:cysteine proteinase [Sporormia fimetaria CBS 119925]|uniref:ubiquitinyl hydrolase 1 n=1 Tax=Sporormia fimetaria CBS 119925 TaxID=1340428 RepID=A0A6A6VRW7_9PLEO|nr:cysteine proteinase [Sporormia fimetaria CBS 119925]
MPPKKAEANDSPAQKLRKSCNACTAGKVKCPSERPTCSRCDNRGLSCVYSVFRSAKRKGGRKTSPRRAADDTPTPLPDGSNTASEAPVAETYATLQNDPTSVAESKFPASELPGMPPVMEADNAPRSTPEPATALAGAPGSDNPTHNQNGSVVNGCTTAVSEKEVKPSTTLDLQPISEKEPAEGPGDDMDEDNKTKAPQPSSEKEPAESPRKDPDESNRTQDLHPVPEKEPTEGREEGPNECNRTPVHGKKSESTHVASSSPLPSIEGTCSLASSPSRSIIKKRLSPPVSENDAPPSSKKRCNGLKEEADSHPLIPPRFRSPPSEAATLHDKEKWAGWCEIESDPAYISAMIRMMHVRDLTVQQVYSIDTDSLLSLPQPVYGLIFLFRYRTDGHEAQERPCPKDVWFANQMPAQNSCATLAIMNILMNSPEDVDVGENLRQFKDFTKDFSPYLRGESFASFRFVKRIHNSFAKKMDMLENDKQLAEKVQKAKKPGRKKKDEDTELEDAALHFISFVPTNGHVFKLDGMDCQPTSLGAYDIENPQSWLGNASKVVMSMMETAGDQEYSVLSVVRSPVISLRGKLLTTIAIITAIEERLSILAPNWRGFLLADNTTSEPLQLEQVQADLGISPNLLSNPAPPEAVRETIITRDLPGLLALRTSTIGDQLALRNEIMEEMNKEIEEDAKAKERQWDRGPAIQKWLEILAEKGWLKANLARFM